MEKLGVFDASENKARLKQDKDKTLENHKNSEK